MSVRFLDEVEHDVQELVSCLGVRMTDYDTQQHWDQLLKHTHTHTHGGIQSLDWIGGLDQWTGTVDSQKSIIRHCRPI